MRCIANHLFGKSRVDQRELCAALRSCALTWAMVIKVIKVHTENCDRPLIGSNRLNHVHKCCFAMETTVEIIALIIDALKFCGFQLNPSESPLRSKRTTIVVLTCCKRWRYCRQHRASIATKRLVCHVGKKR
jgi:hypothetical protein